MKRPPPGCCRIVLTGGPGGGKTTAADLFRREIGERVVIVPEAATILFQGGFPRSHEPHASRFAQTTIFHVQRNLEDVQAALYPGRTLLCDRGTVDGAAYWPGEPHHYFNAVGTTLETELRRFMVDSRQRYTPVMDGTTLLGVVSFHDVAKAILEEQSYENRMLKNYITDQPAA